MELQTVATINDVKLTILNGRYGRVPIKPICELLGINAKAQRDKIKAHYILGEVGVLEHCTGKDGKQYRMFTIPSRYVFGWICSINPKNVSPKARGLVIKYQSACYDAFATYIFEPGKIKTA